MKEYKVESLSYYTKPFSGDPNHILKSSSSDIQEKLDEYALADWRLVSTNMSNFGAALYIYLYFEREVLRDLEKESS